MGKRRKKKNKKPPVVTGGDFRAVERSAAEKARSNAVSAPDGVSGTWQ